MTFELKEDKVSVLNLTIYKYFLPKSLIFPILLGTFMLFMGLLMGAIWPEFESVIKDPGFQQLLSSGFYQALIPGSGSIPMDTYMGFWAMELMTILEIFTLFIAVLLPARIISNEVDKNTLDIALSYPIPRWQFVFQKFLVYLSQMVIFIFLLSLGAVISTQIAGQPFDYEALFLASVAIFILFFTFGSLSLFAASLFLDSGRSYVMAGIFVIGSYLINLIGEILVLGGEEFKQLEIIKNLSIHYYLVPGDVLGTGSLPVVETLIVLSIGILAFIGALFVFQKKELAY